MAGKLAECPTRMPGASIGLAAIAMSLILGPGVAETAMAIPDEYANICLARE